VFLSLGATLEMRPSFPVCIPGRKGVCMMPAHDVKKDLMKFMVATCLIARMKRLMRPTGWISFQVRSEIQGFRERWTAGPKTYLVVRLMKLTSSC